MTQADFVRAHASLAPKDVVAQAKTEDAKFDVGYVRNVRGADKAAGEKKGAATKTSTLAVANGSGPSITATATSAEDLLRAVAAEIALGRAVERLQGERARVIAILRVGGEVSPAEGRASTDLDPSSWLADFGQRSY